jgi:hypothetical protein
MNETWRSPMNETWREYSSRTKRELSERIIAAGRQPGQRTYEVTIKVDGTYPPEPCFEGRTGNAYPDVTCVVWALDEWKARTRAMIQFHDYPLNGEMVDYVVTEIEEG